DSDVTVEGTNFNTCSAGETCSSDIELDTSDLDSESSFELSVTVEDQVPNSETYTGNFTLDTEYSGDTSPSVNVVGEDDGIVEYEEDTDIEVDFESADTNGGEARCDVGGTTIDTVDLDSAEDGEDELVCNLDDDDDDYYDTTAEVVIEMEDAAGNDESYSYGDVTFDASEPTVSNLESVNGLSTFNSNFEADFDAFDSASDVEEYEYYFNGNSDSGTTNTYDDGQFTVDLEGSDLDSGEHNLHVRVRDEAGRWSSSELFEFEYYPDRNPEVSLNTPENMSLTAGESDDFNVEVENTGEFLIESVSLDVSSDVFSDQSSIENLEPGDSVTETYQVDSSEDQIGEYTVDVSTEGPSSSGSFNLRIKANQEQQSSIESRLNEYEQKLESLNSNVSELKQAVSEEQSTRLTSNISEFRNDVESARQAVEDGEYYRAQSSLNGIDSDFSTAKTTYENVEQEYASSQRFKMILGGFAVLLIGGVGGVFLLNREDVIDVDQYLEQLKETAGDTEVGGEGGFIDGVRQKISEVLDNEPDAEEFEWDGFNS
ncbi:MAG: archaellum component FlaC, partial [Candidatus Nanohaloarchaea archaeon]